MPSQRDNRIRPRLHEEKIFGIKINRRIRRLEIFCSSDFISFSYVESWKGSESCLVYVFTIIKAASNAF